MNNATRTFLLSLVLAGLGAVADVYAKGNLTPLEVAASTLKGELRNPYSDSGRVAEEGHKI